MIRDVNPLPAALVDVATVSAPKISSFATVVVAAPLFARRTAPARPCRHIQRTVTPWYSRIRISGYTRRLAERHRHRIAATHDVRRIVDRLSQPRSARRPNRQTVVVPRTVFHRLHRRRRVVPSHHHDVQVPRRLRSWIGHRHHLRRLTCGVAAATCPKPIATAGL